MNIKIICLFLFIISFQVNAEVHDRIRVTGQIYKKFTPERVQVKDEYGQIFEISRSAFPKTVKVHDGQVFSFEVPTDQVFYRSKKNKKRTQNRRVPTSK